MTYVTCTKYRDLITFEHLSQHYRDTGTSMYIVPIQEQKIRRENIRTDERLAYSLVCTYVLPVRHR